MKWHPCLTRAMCCTNCRQTCKYRWFFNS